MRAFAAVLLFAAPAVGQVPRGPFPRVAASADGELVPPGTVRVFGSSRFKSGPVFACDFSPDGRRIVTVGERDVTAWTYPGGEKLWTTEIFPAGYYAQVRYSTDTADIWAYVVNETGAGAFPTLYRLDARTGHVRSRTDLDSYPYSRSSVLTRGGAVFCLDEGRVLRMTTELPQTVVAWDMRPDLIDPDGQADELVPFSVREDGRYLAYVSQNFLKVIDLPTRREVYAVAVPPDHGPVTLSLAAACPRVVLAWSMGTGPVRAYNFAGPRPGPGPEVELQADSPSDGQTPDVGWLNLHPTPDGRFVIVTSGIGHPTRIVDFDRRTVSVASALMFDSSQAAVHPAGTAVALCTDDLGFWSLPDLRSLPHSAEFVGQSYYGGGRLTLSADGRTLTHVTSGLGGAARWEVTTGREVRRWDGMTTVAVGLASPSWALFSRPSGWSDGERPFVRIESDPRHPPSEDIPPGRFRFVVHRPGGAWRALPVAPNQSVTDLVMAPDGRHLLATASHGDVTVLDTTTGRTTDVEPTEIEQSNRWLRISCSRGVQPHPAGWAFSALNVNGSDGPTARGSWSLAVFSFTGREVTRYRGRGLVKSSAWSPDGRTLAVLVEDEHRTGTVAHRIELRRFPHSPSGVRSFPVRPATDLRYTPDGFSVVTMTSDTAHVGRPKPGLHFWELASGRCRRVVAPVAADSPVEFSPDGRLLAALTMTGRPFVLNLAESLPTTTGADLTAAWADLAGEDAVAADRAMRLFRQHRALAEPFARRQPSEPPFDPARVRKLAADLDSPRFVVRIAADAELTKATRAERAELSRLLPVAKSAESRDRLTTLLARPRPPLDPAELRAARLVEAFAGRP